MLIDTHCHLNDERLFDEAERIVNDFASDGIESAVCVGYDLPSSRSAVEISEKFDKIYAAAGIHPHEAKTADASIYAELKELCKKPKTVAVGEIGLDYFYDLSPRGVQQKVFAEQLETAASVGLPVILHIRDAYEDARRILFENKSFLTNGLVLHCYSGSAEMVKEFDKLDAYYSFGGAITFKNAKHNLESLAAVRKDRLLLETDCPYMTPVPYRGQTNYPKYINLVADKAAEIKNIDREKLIEITTENAKRLFSKMK